MSILVGQFMNIMLEKELVLLNHVNHYEGKE